MKNIKDKNLSLKTLTAGDTRRDRARGEVGFIGDSLAPDEQHGYYSLTKRGRKAASWLAAKFFGPDTACPPKI